MDVKQAIGDYYAGNYEAARQLLRPLADKTDEDFVLNNCRLGSACLPDYDLDEAEASFLKAYEVINSVGVNDGGRSLGAAVVAENIKVWKGEPFERAMANFYLGLVYYIKHDYNNARAAFENALFKLDDEDDKGKEHTVSSNFALARVMLAKCLQRLGREGDARSAFDDAKKAEPWLAGLCDYDRNLKSNVLLVIDYGYGPKKTTNSDGAFVGFSPAPWQVGPVPQPLVAVDGAPSYTNEESRPPMDLLAMAQDRKWQSIDTIRAIKDIAGTGLLIGGAVEGMRGAMGHGARQRSDLITGAALAGAGLLLKASSKADVRQWELLPRTTFLVPLQLPPGKHEISVQFPAGVRQTWRNMDVPRDGEATYYFKMQRWNSGPFNWPPSPVAPPPPAPNPPAS